MRLFSILFLSLFVNFSLFSQGEICDDAVEITINDTYIADGPSAGAGCFTCPDDATNADWFKFTPTNSGNISVSSCLDGVDTHFYVYEGTCDALTEVAANDDAGCGDGTNFASYAEFAVTAGTEYHLEWVDHWSNEGFSFVIEEISCPTPTQLNFANLTDQSIDVEWTSTNTGVSFVVEYGEFGFTQGSGTSITGDIGVDGPPVSIMGLNPSTMYEVYVTENCSGGPVTIGPVNFNTFADVAANDVCANAIEIACGDNLVGSTTNATFDVNAITCGDVDVVANSVWYHFTGVDGFITVSTCGTINYDTRLSVYEGDCGALTCIASNDDDLDCENFTATSHFPSTTGTDYYILVHGFEGDSGEFDLALTCGPVCAPVPANGSCATAEAVTPTTGCTFVSSTNSCASINLTSPPCSPFLETQDVWYSFNSGDNTSLGMDINLTGAEEMGFSIFENCIDNALICLTGTTDLEVFSVQPNTEYFVQFWSQFDDAGTFEFCLRDDVCSGATDVTATVVDATTMEVNWTTANPGSTFSVEYGEFGFGQGEEFTIDGIIGVEGPPVTLMNLQEGTLYEYYVIESCAVGDVIAGPFTFTTGGSAPDNDSCGGAINLDACGDIVVGSTINASVETVPECNDVPSTSPGVWYVMSVDASSFYSLSTCNNTNFDSKISIYSGTCGNLTCLDANDDGDNCADGSSEIEFTGIDGDLYVLVHGFGSEEGNFTLTAECAIGLDELNIDNAMTMYPNPTSGMLNIRFADVTSSSPVYLSVFNVNGQEVFTQSALALNQGEIRNIDLSSLAGGLYTVLVSNGDLISRSKLIIE